MQRRYSNTDSIHCVGRFMQHLCSPLPTLLVFTQVGFEHLHQDEHQLLRRVLPGDKSRGTDFPQDGDLPPAQAAV